MALRPLAPRSRAATVDPSPAVSSLQQEHLVYPKSLSLFEPKAQASQDNQTCLPSQLTKAPETIHDQQTCSEIVFARDLLPQIHSFAFPSNVTFGKQVLFSPSSADKLWAQSFGQTYAELHKYYRADQVLAILGRFKDEHESQCWGVNSLDNSLNRLYSACRIGLINFQQRQLHQGCLREYCEIRLTMHVYKPSRIIVRSVSHETGVTAAVLKYWQPYGDKSQQVCLTFETGSGDSIREIADWPDTINPDYKTFQMPILHPSDIKVHGYNGVPQGSAGTLTAQSVVECQLPTTVLSSQKSSKRSRATAFQERSEAASVSPRSAPSSKVRKSKMPRRESLPERSPSGTQGQEAFKMPLNSIQAQKGPVSDKLEPSIAYETAAEVSEGDTEPLDQ